MNVFINNGLNIMGFFNTIKSSLKLPSLRKPEKSSSFNKYLSNYGWVFRSSNKTMGDYGLYHGAETNVYVYRSIQIISDTLLINGFSINNPDEFINDTSRVSYLTSVFNNPGGLYNEITYPMFHKQYMTSLELTGDAFIEVNHEEFNYNDKLNSIVSGFTFIPPELLKWFEDTDQWGYRNQPDIRYEDEDLIHIYEPHIRLKESKYGVSKLDKIRLPLMMMLLGLDHNLDLLENDGIDPRAILSFDKELTDEAFESELIRLSALDKEKKRGGTLAVKGATFQSSSLSNNDMDFMTLMNMCRDMILTAYGVQPGKAGIRETANLGTGSGESQDKDFKDMMCAKARLIEGCFNKNLGHNGFNELFQFNEMDIEDKLKRVQIEGLKIDKGILSVNEVRKSYGLDPVPWGDYPINNNNNGIPGGTVDSAKSLKNTLVHTGVLDEVYYG